MGSSEGVMPMKGRYLMQKEVSVAYRRSVCRFMGRFVSGLAFEDLRLWLQSKPEAVLRG
jgi:hypothetical protein